MRARPLPLFAGEQAPFPAMTSQLHASPPLRLGRDTPPDAISRQTTLALCRHPRSTPGGFNDAPYGFLWTLSDREKPAVPMGNPTDFHCARSHPPSVHRNAFQRTAVSHPVTPGTAKPRQDRTSLSARPRLSPQRQRAAPTPSLKQPPARNSLPRVAQIPLFRPGNAAVPNGGLHRPGLQAFVRKSTPGTAPGKTTPP